MYKITAMNIDKEIEKYFKLIDRYNRDSVYRKYINENPKLVSPEK